MQIELTDNDRVTLSLLRDRLASQTRETAPHIESMVQARTRDIELEVEALTRLLEGARR